MFMVHNLAMIKINIHEAKARLSEYLERVLEGEVVVLCRRNVPVAEIHPLPARRSRRRPIGVARGKLSVPPSFFAPLPEEVLKDFQGNTR